MCIHRKDYVAQLATERKLPDFGMRVGRHPKPRDEITTRRDGSLKGLLTSKAWFRALASQQLFREGKGVSFSGWTNHVTLNACVHLQSRNALLGCRVPECPTPLDCSVYIAAILSLLRPSIDVSPHDPVESPRKFRGATYLRPKTPIVYRKPSYGAVDHCTRRDVGYFYYNKRPSGA